MEASPLTQQARPQTFQPKIVHLYEELFKEDEEVEKPEGFWQEFFLHKPDGGSLRQLLHDLSPDELLHFQVRRRSHCSLHSANNVQEHPQQLFIRAIERAKVGVAPSDENALDVCFLSYLSLRSDRLTN